ncbi:MAG TPA: Stk1 family PASTA domain-containing Ser/Thr kinase [Jiangellaceae bacterium]
MDLSAVDASAGRLLDGRYRIEATVASGGMATVYRALDTRLDRIVALKVMHPELAVDGEFVSRFISEARAAAKLSHPAVVGVFDQGEDGGSVYLSMEYVDGRTLRQILRERGRLTPVEALDMIEPVLAALAEAHEAGIVHCDVKPENVLVSENGKVKVADFGLARALADPAGTDGPLLGTVNYISPEQALGGAATPRSDVYAVGIMLYELLTGSPPHSAATDEAVVRNHIDRDVPPPSAVDGTVSPAIDDLVRRLTARDPHHRYPSAETAELAIEQARRSAGSHAEGIESLDSAGVSVGEALHRAGDGPPAGQQTSLLPVTPPAEQGTRGRRASALPATTRRPATARRAAPARRASSSRRPSGRRGGPQWRQFAVLGVLIALIGGVIAGAWWLGEGRYIETPSLLDMTFEEAQQRAAQDGLRIVNGGTEPSDVYAEGRVMRTDPGPGAKALRGVNVVVILSSGPDLVGVPDVRNLPRADAEQKLADAGLTADVTEEYSTDVDEGRVISQSEEPGSEVKRDSTIALVVSQGPEPLEITDYTGRDAEQAQQELTELGFKVEISEGENRNVPPGIVISQEPRFGTGYAGDTIELEVAGGPSEIRMPSVLGMPVEQAEQHLRNLGFEKIKIEERGDFLGLVVRQKPNAGEEVKLDKEVVLFVR